MIIYTSTKSEESLLAALQQNGNIIVSLCCLCMLCLSILYLILSVIQMVLMMRCPLWSLWRVQYLATNKHGIGIIHYYIVNVFSMQFYLVFACSQNNLVSDQWGFGCVTHRTNKLAMYTASSSSNWLAKLDIWIP